MSNELNIKSSTIEKGLDLAKGFVNRLIGPSIDEIGLLFADNLKLIRFKNQVRMLLKAREYVDMKGIKIKEVPIKLLVPLLEGASLEDDENLQDKWTNMLINMVDSEANFQNHIFPYILSQVSINEFEALKSLMTEEEADREEFNRYQVLLQDDPYCFNGDTKRLREETGRTKQSGHLMILEEFEISNIARLGLIRVLPPTIIIEEFKTEPNDEYGRPKEQWHQLNAEYETDDNGCKITELGRMFLDVCTRIDQ